MGLRIGIDTGGTFTDVVLVGDDGRSGVGKALSTHGDLPSGVLDSLGRAARDLGRDLESALAAAELVAYSTTVGINALLTRSGARLALLTTAGFEATLPIARANKVFGLPEADRTEATRWAKPPLLLPRPRIVGVRERVDVRGEILIPLDEADARERIAALREDGVESYAISLLWSVAEPRHEQRLAELVREVHPGAHVSVSSDVAPRIGEYERTVTVALDAYVAPLVADELRALCAALAARGFGGSFVVMQSSGGVRPTDRALHRCVETLNSGPVAGVIASRGLARESGLGDVVATDVGGTSFDVSILEGGEPSIAQRPMIGRFPLATPVVEVVSIGTGGGSIARIDPALGSLRVGPQSAGADPGPACYGHGGTQATLTDAAVVLGYMSGLGGALSLDRDAAERAVAEHVAGPLGRSPVEAAEAIVRVACAQMGDLVRRVTVQRGHDPRRFTLLAYGGAAPQYAGRYAAEMGIARVVVPAAASVFSAWGAASSDLRSRLEREVAPLDPRHARETIAAELRDLEARVREELDDPAGAAIARLLGLRFRGQARSLQIALGPDELTDAAIEAALARFHADYERLVGPGAASRNSAVELVSVGIDARVAIGSQAAPAARRPARRAGSPRDRRVFFDGGFVDCPVLAGDELAEDTRVEGPALIELPTTTLVVFPGQRVAADAIGNLDLELETP